MYCLTATAFKNNMRLITVVMGEPDSKVRSSETAAMLDYGFNSYSMDSVLTKDKVLKKVKVDLGEKEYIDIVSIEDINVLNTKTGDKRKVKYKVEVNNIKAPVKVGNIVGKIKVYEDNKLIMSMNATVRSNVKKANIITVFLRNIKDIIIGNI